MKKYLVLLLIIIIIASVIVISRKNKTEIVKQEFIRLVDFEVAEKGEVLLKKQFFGTIKGLNQTEIYPNVPGKFIKYNVKEGEYVKKDQIVAEIDRSIPGMVYETAKIIAPISGIVYDLTFVKGQPTMPQMPVAMISDPSNLTARINVSKDILEEVQQSINAEIYINDVQYKGKVIRKSYLPNNMTQMGSIDVQITNGNRKLINSPARIYLHTSNKQNVLRVSSEAYQTKDNKSFIYIFKNGKANILEVEIGLTGNEYVQITNALEEGDTVITMGSSLIHDEQSVRIK